MRGFVEAQENGDENFLVHNLFTSSIDLIPFERFVCRQIFEQIIKYALFNVLLTCYNSVRSSFCPYISLSTGRGSLSLDTSSWASAHSPCLLIFIHQIS